MGCASLVLESGVTVGAFAVVIWVGSCVDPATGELYAARFAREGEFGDLRRPSSEDLGNAAARGLFSAVGPTGDAMAPSLNTTIGVVATDAVLTKAQCAKLAGIAHDGMARAIRPVHTMFDGDTVYGLSTGDGDQVDLLALQAVLEAADDCFTRAVGHAILAAETVTLGGGEEVLSYRDAFPSAVSSA
jgi:putative pantetheine hydrolase